MKKIIRFMSAFFFLMFVIPPAAVSAAAGGELTVEGQNITVTVYKPPDEAQAVTSLRFWLYVAVSEGEIEDLVFTFSDTVPGIIQDAAVRRQENKYVIDLILAGKRNQDIFQGGTKAVIGTLSLRPSGQSVRAEIGMAGESAADGSQPVLKYVSASGRPEQTIPFSEVKPAVYRKTDTAEPAVPDTTEPAVPDITKPEFSQDAVPQLQLNVKNTTRSVTFQWSPVDGADGYKIYQYQEDTGKYKRIKTITDAGKTAYSKKMAYGTAYRFRMRAFCTGEDGSKTYGAYSKAKQVWTAPEKVKGLTVQQEELVLTWNQVLPADGYQIFCSTSKNGTYNRVKTIKKADTCMYLIKKPAAGKTYYKVRAYVIINNGKRTYGAFSGKAVVS